MVLIGWVFIWGILLKSKEMMGLAVIAEAICMMLLGVGGAIENK